MNIIFAGTPDFAANHLQGLLDHDIGIAAVITQPDKPGKRGKKLVPSAVKVLAESRQIPVLQPEKLSATDLKALQPDLLIVVAYGQILRQDLLDTPGHGCINVHGSILPRWRGAAPIQRAVESGDAETGICIMQMDAGLDTGPVLYEARTQIQPTDTSGDLAERLAALGIEGLLHVLDDLEQGRSKPIPQAEDGATYAKKILKAEAKLVWSNSAVTLRNKIHAFNPDPVCFCELEHDHKVLRVKLHRASVLPGKTQREPGEILEVTPEGVAVATADGNLLIEQLQLPLGKGSVLTGRDILNARADMIYPGVRFT